MEPIWRFVVAGVVGLTLGASFSLTSATADDRIGPDDTETCVSHGEFSNMELGLTQLQVANRFDIYGKYLDDTQTRFRRGYRTCWDPTNTQAVVVFSYASNESVDWYTRDI